MRKQMLIGFGWIRSDKVQGLGSSARPCRHKRTSRLRVLRFRALTFQSKEFKVLGLGGGGAYVSKCTMDGGVPSCPNFSLK